MIDLDLKHHLTKLVKILLKVSRTDFGPNEKLGLTFVWRYLLARLPLVGVLTTSGFAAAIFEGGTVGLLGIAVSILVGEQDLAEISLIKSIPPLFGTSLLNLSKDTLFIALIAVAISSQILKNLLLYASEACQLYLSYGLRREMQNELVRKIMDMSLARVTKYPVGQLATVVDQGDLVAQIMGQVGLVIRAMFMALAYAAVMVWMSPSIAVGTLIVIWILWVCLSQVIKKIRKLADQAFRKRIDVWRWTIEFLSAPRLVRIFNASQYTQDLITKARDQELGPDRKTDLIQALVPKVLETVTVTGAGLFLVGGFILAGDSAIKAVPTFFVYVLVFFRIRPLIKTFNDFRMKVAHIVPRLAAVGDILNVESQQQSCAELRPFSSLKDGVRFDHVSFRYDGNSDDALQGINLAIPRGCTTALVGASGGGKSTLADLFLGLYMPSEGLITIDGIDVKDVSVESWRAHIGVVDQEVFLLNTSVRENILFSRPDLDDTHVHWAAKVARAHEFILTLKDGYETIIGDRGFRLSGGQRQRLGLARALVHDPEILVLDEATSALDSKSEKLIQESLEEMHSKKTILIIAHRLSTIRNADQIVVIDGGQIREQGSREKLLAKKGYFYEAWRVQTENEKA